MRDHYVRRARQHSHPCAEPTGPTSIIIPSFRLFDRLEESSCIFLGR